MGIHLYVAILLQALHKSLAFLLMPENFWHIKPEVVVYFCRVMTFFLLEQILLCLSRIVQIVYFDKTIFTICKRFLFVFFVGFTLQLSSNVI